MMQALRHAQGDLCARLRANDTGYATHAGSLARPGVAMYR